jgi:hypothetical protein
MTLAVILLSLSDVRLVKQDEHRSHRSAMQHRFASLNHGLLGVSSTILLKLMYILRAPLHNLLGLDKMGKRR